MNILIIPSWYPSPASPSAGIFFKEQALALAGNHAELNIGISTWGPNDPRLLLEAQSAWTWPAKIWRSKRIPATETSLLPNCVEYYRPTLTWTRRWRKGNIEKIILSNEINAKLFIDQFGKVDIIHAHTAHPGGFIAMHLAQSLNVPYVVTEHMSPFPLRAYSNIQSFDRWIRPPMQHAAANIAVSTRLQDKMNTSGIASLVIPNLVSETFFKPSDAPYDPHQLLAIGRLESQKGYPYLLRAFRQLLETHPRATLTIVGSGKLEVELRALSQSLGISERVRWYGEATRDEVVAALQRASFLVLPSLHENLPLVLLEAIACGKPIVATRCGGPEEIVNTSNGLMAEVADHEDLSQKMIHMLDHRKAYSEITIRQDFEERFSSKAVTKQLRELYEKVLAEYNQ